MAGLGALLFGLVFGGSAISAAKDNMEMMKKPVRYLEDGTPVYIDRKARQHINGERVVSQWRKDEYGNVDMVDVGTRSGRIYYDPKDEHAKRMREMYDEPNLRRAKENGDLTCKLWYPQFKQMLSTELSTNKIIIKIEANYETDEYRKYYYTGGYDPIMSNACFIQPQPGNNGVKISKEEYDKLESQRDRTYIL